MKHQTYQIAKSFYQISNAKKYLSDLIKHKDVHHSSKNLLSAFVKRLDWIETEMKTTLKPENADVFRKEIETFETLSFDAVFDAMVLMNPEQREQVENYCEEILKNKQ